MKHRDRGAASPHNVRWIDHEGNLMRSPSGCVPRDEYGLDPVVVVPGDTWHREGL